MEGSEVYRLLEGRITDAEEKGGHKIYNIIPQEEKLDEEKGFQVFQIGRRHPANPPTSTRCVLLLGETGAGKTTFINAVLNYLFGVKFEDPFRLQVEEKLQDGRLETDSRTEIVTVYTVYYQEGMKHKYNFVLIDTPGLADSRGVQQQQSMMGHLEALLTSDFGVVALHCLGIVAKGNTNTCVNHQRILLEKIVSLLGKFVPDITHVFATHALEKVSVDAVVRDCGITFQSMFKFDNGCLFDPKETDEPYDPRKRWNKMAEQYDTLFDYLITAPSVSIEILREKKLYDICKKNLGEQIENLVDLTLENYNTLKILTENEFFAEENREWMKTELKIKSIVLESGIHAHNCNVCRKTCTLCNKKLCRVFSSMSGNATVTGKNASLAAVSAAPAITGIFAISVAAGVAVTSAVAAIGLSTVSALKLATNIKGKKKCKMNDCGHPWSEHLMEMNKYVYEENEIINEDMRKRHFEAQSEIKNSRHKHFQEQQKIKSVKNLLSSNLVELLYHAKRIQEITLQDSDYFEDITYHLNGIQEKYHSSSIQAEIYKNILKEVMEEVHSCTIE